MSLTSMIPFVGLGYGSGNENADSNSDGSMSFLVSLGMVTVVVTSVVAILYQKHRIQEIFNNNESGMKKTLKTVAQGVLDFTNTIIDWFKNLASKIRHMFILICEKIANTFKQLATATLDGLEDIAVRIGKWVFEFTWKTAKFGYNTYKSINNMRQSIQRKLDQTEQDFQIAVANKVASEISGLIHSVVTLSSDGLDIMGGLWNDMSTKLEDSFRSVWDNTTKSVSELESSVTEIYDFVDGECGDVLRDIGATLDYIRSLGSNLAQLVDKYLGIFVEWVGNVGLPALIRVGDQIRDLANKIGDVAGGVISTVGDAAEDAWDDAGDFFGWSLSSMHATERVGDEIRSWKPWNAKNGTAKGLVCDNSYFCDPDILYLQKKYAESLSNSKSVDSNDQSIGQDDDENGEHGGDRYKL